MPVLVPFGQGRQFVMTPRVLLVRIPGIQEFLFYAIRSCIFSMDVHCQQQEDTNPFQHCDLYPVFDRCRNLSRALAASTSRFFGEPVVSNDSSSDFAAAVTCTTAWSNAS